MELGTRSSEPSAWSSSCVLVLVVPVIRILTAGGRRNPHSIPAPAPVEHVVPRSLLLLLPPPLLPFLPFLRNVFQQTHEGQRGAHGKQLGGGLVLAQPSVQEGAKDGILERIEQPKGKEDQKQSQTQPVGSQPVVGTAILFGNISSR